MDLLGTYFNVCSFLRNFASFGSSTSLGVSGNSLLVSWLEISAHLSISFGVGGGFGESSVCREVFVRLVNWWLVRVSPDSTRLSHSPFSSCNFVSRYLAPILGNSHPHARGTGNGEDGCPPNLSRPRRRLAGDVNTLVQFSRTSC